MTITHRQPPAGLVHHMDRGALYGSGNYRRLMTTHGLLPSMSHHGNCYDNACAESFFSSLKNELTHGQAFVTRAAAKLAIVGYIEGSITVSGYIRHLAIEHRPMSTTMP